MKINKDFPPKTHNLNYLVELNKISLNHEQSEFLPILMKNQLEGRYPESFPVNIEETKANDYLNQTKQLSECLKKML